MEISAHRRAAQWRSYAAARILPALAEASGGEKEEKEEEEELFKDPDRFVDWSPAGRNRAKMMSKSVYP